MIATETNATITKPVRPASNRRKPAARKPAPPAPAPVRKRVLPLFGWGSIEIIDMGAVLK